MRKISTLMLITLVAAACGSSSPAPTRTSPAATSAVPSPSAQAQAQMKKIDPRKDGLEVGFGEFAITLEARDIRPGAVTLVIHNGGRLVHGFEMKAEDQDGHGGHGGGGDEFKLEAPTFGPDGTIRIKANLAVGTYEIECYVANHETLGMRTTLVVRRDAPLVRPTASAPGDVSIEGFAFSPAITEVRAGTTVEWTNNDPTEHTVTARNGSFGSEPLASGEGFRVTFDQPGSFAYSCAIHPTMTGTIQVAS
jgi:plastocyanin